MQAYSLISKHVKPISNVNLYFYGAEQLESSKTKTMSRGYFYQGSH